MLYTGKRLTAEECMVIILAKIDTAIAVLNV